jgi:hypothetical protein
MDTTDLASDGQLALEQTLAIRAPRIAGESAGAGSVAAAGLVVLFASTLFLSAFLLFLVQPMMAKMVLPMLGGSPAVWNGCMVFFQMLLVAGYGYAYSASRLQNTRARLLVHAGLLLIPFAVLPVLIDRQAAVPPENPIGWLFLLLAGSIGLPFFALSTSASTLQHWFSRTSHPAARDPYFLYVSSNLGSLLALVLYPTLVEPWLALGEQSRLWSFGYAAFVALAGACALTAFRHTPAGDQSATSNSRPRDREPATPLATVRRARWIALSFVPSSLMLAVTTYLSTDIAAVPLLWILPLALYLLTFIVAFGSKTSPARTMAGRAVPLLVVPLVLLMTTQVSGPLLVIVPLHLAAFVFVALLCHSELAHDRPAPAHLTEFYFWISVGGMLGGIFNTLIAPVIFSGISEYPLVLALACLVLPAIDTKGASRLRVALDWLVPVGIGGLSVGLLVWAVSHGTNPKVVLALITLPALASYGQRRRPLRFTLSLAAMLLAGSWFAGAGEPVLHRARTFFGVYRVSLDRTGRYHGLAHGTTLHGMQALDSGRRSEPLTYYHRTGPFGQAFEQLPHIGAAKEIAVIGLGVGTLASYARPGQHWTFYEIDPEVERIARTSAYFTFLDACAEQCRVVLGDARLSLARSRPRQFDLIVLDAFSSDAIPVHLLTHEALSLYLSRLAPGGTLAFHISNHHLALGPVVADLAASHHLAAVERFDRRTPDWPQGKSESQWVIIGRSVDELGSLNRDPGWTPLLATPSTTLWTDDFSNILSVLKLH